MLNEWVTPMFNVPHFSSRKSSMRFVQFSAICRVFSAYGMSSLPASVRDTSCEFLKNRRQSSSSSSCFIVCEKVLCVTYISLAASEKFRRRANDMNDLRCLSSILFIIFICQVHNPVAKLIKSSCSRERIFIKKEYRYGDTYKHQ